MCFGEVAFMGGGEIFWFESFQTLCSIAMEELDGDEVRVSSRGRFAERDIVQVKPSSSSSKHIFYSHNIVKSCLFKFVRHCVMPGTLFCNQNK